MGIITKNSPRVVIQQQLLVQKERIKKEKSAHFKVSERAAPACIAYKFFYSTYLLFIQVYREGTIIINLYWPDIT